MRCLASLLGSCAGVVQVEVEVDIAGTLSSFTSWFGTDQSGKAEAAKHKRGTSAQSLAAPRTSKGGEGMGSFAEEERDVLVCRVVVEDATKKLVVESQVMVVNEAGLPLVMRVNDAADDALVLLPNDRAAVPVRGESMILTFGSRG
jgi:hypothetical protein